VKSLTSLWSVLAVELASRCCTSATRDITTVVRRTEHEGLSFLAITLADYGKAVQKWLDQGFVVPSDCVAFRRHGPTGFPAFLRGFLERVFDSSNGVLLDTPCIESIQALRLLTLTFGKIALPDGPREGSHLTDNSGNVVSPERERVAMREFVECEQEVKDSDARLDPSYMDEFKRMSNMLFGDVLAKVDRDVYWGRVIPKHGPGAVADSFTANGKWNQRTWPLRLQQALLTAEDCLIPNYSFNTEEFQDEVRFLEPGAEMPVKVIAVPKSLKSPRVIGIEPAAMQYAQQGLSRCLLSAIREDGFLSRTVGLNDQTPNQELARLGSLSGDLATLDLSEASDRVSNQHVLAMFEDYPMWNRAVQASRSRKAEVPGHGVIRLAKFSTMGSALCFPVEQMVFLTIIALGIQRELSTPLTRGKLVKLFSGRVRVFGDDLIVPADYVLSVVDELENFGYRVNVSKSFWIGRFRESCGKEYYDGNDVSIVKVRRVLPTRRQDVKEVVSAVSLRNQLYHAGLWQGARWMDSYLGRLLKVFPNVGPSSSLLGRESYLGCEFETLDPNTHGPLTKGYSVRAKPPSDPLDGAGALLKCFVRSGPEMGYFAISSPNPPQGVWEPRVDADHLERSGRPERVDIKLGRRSPL
jgi:hypothetical protein